MWSRRILRSATFVLVGATALVAIVTIDSRGGPTFQDEVSRSLADRSDAVAASLARGDRCMADRDADLLRSDSVVVVRRGLVSPRMAGELLTRTRRLAQSLTCLPQAPAQPSSPPPPPPETTRPTPHVTPPPHADHHGKGKGEDRGEHGRGKKRGHRRGDEDSG